MLNDYFTWNGKKSSDFGIIIKHKEIYKSPARDVDFVEVPGQDGEVILDNGRYKNVDVNYQVRVKNVKSKLLEIANWLSAVGYQKLIDSDDSTHYRMAARTGSVDWNYLGKGEWADLEIAFNCKPWRYLTSGDSQIQKTEAFTVINPTSYDALPRLAFVRTSPYGAITVHINNKSYTFTSNSKTPIRIDSTLQTAEPAANANFDDFPVLKAGENSISWTGGNVSEVYLVPHWREL